MSDQEHEFASEAMFEAVNRHNSKSRLLTAKEVADYLGLPVLAIYGFAREGIIAGVVRIGRSIRFEPEALRQWIANGGQAFEGGSRREPK